MAAKAICKSLTACLTFSAVVLTSIIGQAQNPTPTANWVNIKDPKFGAIGDASHDDTRAIQAAIDYAFAHNLTSVYCPAGNYLTSDTIWLDPPNNMRATFFRGAGYISGTTLTITSVAANSVTIGDYIRGTGVQGATIVTALGTGAGGTGTYTVNNSHTVASAASPIALIANNPSSPTTGQFTMSFFGDPTTGGAIRGCIIQPAFNNAVAFLVGSGQGMRVSDISVIGAVSDLSIQYRGNLPPTGVGIGLSGGSSGSSVNLVENTRVANFYSCYQTDANGPTDLNDSNTWRNVSSNNCYYGINVVGTQAYINDVVEPRISATIAIDSEFAHQVNVFGGNLSAGTAASNSFAISHTSGLFTGTPCSGSGAGRCFTTTVASPDAYLQSSNVYNAFMLSTPHFGIIPLELLAFNRSNNVATFGVWLPWYWHNYGASGGSPSDAPMQADIQAATTLYAAERVEVARGTGIVLEGVHIENANACTTLLMITKVWDGQFSNEIRNPVLDYDPSSVEPGLPPAQIYCQQSFPFIGRDPNASGRFSVKLTGGNYTSTSGVDPVIIDAQPDQVFVGSELGTGRFNLRVFDFFGCSYGQTGNPAGLPSNNCPGVQFATVARGIGQWDRNYFMPSAFAQVLATSLNNSDLAATYCGYEPCQWTIPNLNPTLYSLVSGTLGALGTYPPIACRTVFKSVDWNSALLSHLFLRSASCPGYSWGQHLTTALIGGTVTWSYMAGSDVLYLDANTLSLMFPGLGISLDNGGGAQPYIVTGVYPYLGYATVIWAGSNSGGPLQGTVGTVYSCASSCTIRQAPFSWTAY